MKDKSIFLSHTYVQNVSILKIIIGAIALFASAQLLVPLKPVPISFQTVVVSLIAFTYSPRDSFFTLLLYLLAGLIGLPMFTKLGSGIAHLKGATGGYLTGFLIAAPVMSWLKNHCSRKLYGVMLCCFTGHVIIYLLGISWLATFIGLKQALYSGFIIYIPTGIAKIFAFSYLYTKITTRLS